MSDIPILLLCFFAGVSVIEVAAAFVYMLTFHMCFDQIYLSLLKRKMRKCKIKYCTNKINKKVRVQNKENLIEKNKKISKQPSEIAEEVNIRKQIEELKAYKASLTKTNQPVKAKVLYKQI